MDADHHLAPRVGPRSIPLTLTALLLGLLVVAALAGPTASTAAAQTTQGPKPPPRWAESHLDAPFDTFEVSTRQSDLTVSGVLRFQKISPTNEIVEAIVSISDDPADDYRPPAGCDLPDSVRFPGNGTDSNPYDELPISTTMPMECNGRYLLEVRGISNAPGQDQLVMHRSVVMEALPTPVRKVSLSFDDAADRVTVTWAPVPDADLSPDTFGYLVERAGPASPNGGVGTYVDVRSLDRFDDTRATSTLDEAGTYSFRVRTTRQGPTGIVLSSILETGTAEVRKEPPPTTTTTTTSTAPKPTATTTTGPRIGSAIPTVPNRPPPSFAPPTTIDNGFGETLDYGERPPSTQIITEVPELADEDLDESAQSIVIDEEDGGPSLFLPIAGALVLIGWAGHVLYLNRLAKEL